MPHKHRLYNASIAMTMDTLQHNARNNSSVDDAQIITPQMTVQMKNQCANTAKEVTKLGTLHVHVGNRKVTIRIKDVYCKYLPTSQHDQQLPQDTTVQPCQKQRTNI